MRVTILASGSRGNAALFEHGATRVLVDAGLSPTELSRRMSTAGATRAPTAVVVTHAHGDHLRHAEAVSRRFRVPVYVSESTKRVAPLAGAVSVKVYGAREPFPVGELVVHPLPLPHDAAQVSLKLVSPTGHAAAIATDLGEVPPSLLAHLARCEVVLLESNHDPDMLRTGPYPEFLKRRIASSRGHLSNLQTHALLRRLPREVNAVVLMHLSETNNRPDVALAVAADALADHPARLLVAHQDRVTSVETLGPAQLALPL